MKLRKIDYLLSYTVSAFLLIINYMNSMELTDIIRGILFLIFPALILGTVTNIIFKSKKTLLICSTALLLFSPIFYRIDAGLAAQNKRPIFVIPTAVAKDGGTTVYNGLGYKVIGWRRLEVRQIEGKEVTGNMTGYEISTIFNPQDINKGASKELKFITK